MLKKITLCYNEDAYEGKDYLVDVPEDISVKDMMKKFLNHLVEKGVYEKNCFLKFKASEKNKCGIFYYAFRDVYYSYYIDDVEPIKL